MVDVPIISFILSDNANATTGEFESFTSDELIISNWATGGDSRRQQRTTSTGRRIDSFRSKDLGGGRVLLYAEEPATGKDQYAVTESGSNFEHIWSAWRGQRWSEMPNLDEGAFSFRDIIEFHSSEVFDSVTITQNNFNWLDEYTLNLSQNQTVQIKMKTGWSAIFEHKGFSVNVKSGGDAVRFSGGFLRLDFIQFTGEGVTVTYDEGVVGDEPMLHDDAVVRVVGEVIDTATVDFTPIEPIEGGVKATSNYESGQYVVELIHTADNIESTEVDESKWVVATTHPSGIRPTDTFSTLADGEEGFNTMVVTLHDALTDVNSAQEALNNPEFDEEFAAAEEVEIEKRAAASGDATTTDFVMTDSIMGGLMVAILAALVGVVLIG